MSICHEAFFSEDVIKDLLELLKEEQDAPDRNVGDMISRQAAVEEIKELCEHYTPTKSTTHPHVDFVIEELQQLPSAQPEIKPISYTDCSNAMLMMWMDNVITDGEYNRIMDKLNAKHMAERRTDG